MRTIEGLDELEGLVGEPLGTSDWHEVGQDDVDAFADATGDHQWIHVDVERARDTVFGGTIVHGYFTLALVTLLSDEIFQLRGLAMAVNYGLDHVRFPAPLLVGTRVRLHIEVADLQRDDDGAELVLDLTFEGETAPEPVCVARSLVRLYAA